MDKIVYTKQDMPWLEAREAVKERGGLPPHKLHDEYLVMSDRWKELSAEDYYSAWAREVLVYPEKDGVFSKVKDVIDAYTDDEGRSWIFPAKEIPKEAIGKKKVALFVLPGKVEVKKEKVVVHAEKVTVIENFPQTDGWYAYDEETRIPIDKEPSLTDLKSKRRLWRISGSAVRPLVRWGVWSFDGRRGVGAGGGPYVGRGVGFVEGKAKEKKDESKKPDAGNEKELKETLKEVLQKAETYATTNQGKDEAYNELAKATRKAHKLLANMGESVT